jgi:SP family facilitated glucose transporter-like MFS transporter 8
VVVLVLGVGCFYDAFGRVPLLAASACGCGCGHLLVALSFGAATCSPRLAVAGVLVFIASVSLGLGSLSWVVAAELLPSEVTHNVPGKER